AGRVEGDGRVEGAGLLTGFVGRVAGCCGFGLATGRSTPGFVGAGLEGAGLVTVGLLGVGLGAGRFTPGFSTGRSGCF
ncbi:hypothetical protein MD537_19260, partial [Flavihumibacter sediminis]|nr:hypothetical protein [Flavihumibacter sediminis]